MRYQPNNTRDRGQTATSVAVVVAIVVLMIGGLVAWIGGTWSKTEAIEMTCVYNGGPFDDRSFIGYEEPGNGREYQGFMSSAFDVPTRLLQFRVSATPGQGDTSAPMEIATRVKGYEMFWQPTITFTANTQVSADGKPVACDLIEQHLRGLDATDFNVQGGRWQTKFLEERWSPVLTDVMTRTMQNGYDPGELKFNTGGARERAAAEIGVELKEQLAKQLGGDFFCDSDYRFGQGAEACGNSLTVILPEPRLDDADETQLAKPQRAKVDADNDIAAANEAARKAQEVADARSKEADSAETLADANEEIAKQNARVLEAQAGNEYAWCAYLVTLGQDCALVKAAENGNFPGVILSDPGDAVIAVPATPTTTVPTP